MSEAALLRYDRILEERSKPKGNFLGEDCPLLLVQLPGELGDFLKWLAWTPSPKAIGGLRTYRARCHKFDLASISKWAKEIPGPYQALPEEILWYEKSLIHKAGLDLQSVRFRTIAYSVLTTAKAYFLDELRKIERETEEERRRKDAEKQAKREHQRREARRPMNRKGEKSQLPPNLEYDWLAETHKREGFEKGTGRFESTIKKYTKSLGVMGGDGAFNYSRQDALRVLWRWLAKVERKKSTEYAEVIWNRALERGGDGLKELHSALCPSYAQLEPPPPPPPTLADLFPKLGFTPPG